MIALEPPTAAPRSLHMFTVYVEDLPGVLNRVSALFNRRAYNIESLTVGNTDKPGVSRMTIVVEADQHSAKLVEANLYKLVNVLRVEDVTYRPSVNRDLVLIKVKADAEARVKILQLSQVFRARVVDVDPDSLILEITGDDRKLDGLVDVLRPFGIIELIRTGKIAMTRGVEHYGVSSRSEVQGNGKHVGD